MKMFTGRCVGGPLNGEEIAASCERVIVPANPRPVTDAERAEWEAKWDSPCPPEFFGQVSYRWAEGAWHFGVH